MGQVRPRLVKLRLSRGDQRLKKSRLVLVMPRFEEGRWEDKASDLTTDDRARPICGKDLTTFYR